ncbi:MAG: formylmethanofuran dehydrogenase subunit A [Phycisphaeraceae bacterium]
MLRITNGRVYDPANGVEGVVRDVLIVEGRIAAALPEGVREAALKTIDAKGMIIMPGGVDIHCHIASASVNRARAMLGEEHATHVHPAACGLALRGGTGELTPSTFTTGYRYAALGYTTAIDAAVSPTGARQTHMELADTPNLDAAFLLLVGNHAKVLDLLDKDDETGAVAFIGEMLHQTGAYGIKIVNPGGVASWRSDATQHMVDSLDQSVAGLKRVTPRRILQLAAAAAEQLNLPHAPHVHCNRLGLPGNVDLTLDTLDALDGRRLHLTHLQFHAYGKSDKGEITSAATRLTDHLDTHPLVSADVGQVMFGSAMTLTADTPLEHLLWKLAGKRATGQYVSIEGEMEAGCGLMPIEYSDKHYLHSLQWAIGLELMLTAKDPWRMLLSTDHPNGGSFLTYPRIIAALMSRTIRQEQMSAAHPRAMRDSSLKDLSREMTLSEIAIITRAGPARVLGMMHKGQLGPGADGDVTIYDEGLAGSGGGGDWQRIFESPRYVIKGGHVLVEDGELREAVDGARMCSSVTASEQGSRHLREWFDQHGSYDVSQFGIRDRAREQMRAVNSK